MIPEIKLKTIEELRTEKLQIRLPKGLTLVKVGDKILQLKNKFGMWINV